eukprot:4214803-Ditylum_brightwellii.AAC.1
MSRFAISAISTRVVFTTSHSMGPAIAYPWLDMLAVLCGVCYRKVGNSISVVCHGRVQVDQCINSILLGGVAIGAICVIIHSCSLAEAVVVPDNFAGMVHCIKCISEYLLYRERSSATGGNINA